MTLKILMVDGYDYDGWKSLNEASCIDAFEHYSNTLKKISKPPLKIITIHPGKKIDYLPKGLSLNDFDGIVWTGSSLNIYDSTAPIIRQIDLAKETLKQNVNIFGSCWGLQIYVKAAGGSVRKNPKGREMIFARDIMINKVGENHQMYKNKMKKFDAFCSHLDEIETIPNGSKVLSENKHSKVQALSFKINGAEFWGTQYHPEFNFNIMSRILIARKSILVKENIFNNEDHADKIISIMEQILENKNDGKDLEIGEDILDKNIRNRELINWLNFIEKSK
ncbi:MAG: hypothetical protein CMI95_00515 [Pelagibacteraceae bacterium]|nr:hypothetical protein [Pelagibacteraceae bacterium]|tara:strand:- start:6172 stop:7008 length:837 start_codon:yes stop_codon:yes gene_type:complete